MVDWSMVFSLVTAATAIIALILTGWQIRQDNKQSLFDRRIALWTIAQSLLRLFEKNHNQFDEKNEPLFANDLLFMWLTNNTYLNEIAPTLDHPLEQPFQLIFLRKLEELESLSSEAKLIFKCLLRACPMMIPRVADTHSTRCR